MTIQRTLHLKDGQKKPNQLQLDAGWLIAYAEAHASFNYDDVAAHQNRYWARPYFFAVVREARNQLGQEDEYNLVCDPQGWGELWQYRLVGNYEDAREWSANRQKDMEARLATLHAVATAVTRGADGRSTAGRRAKKIATTVGYLLGELADMQA